MNLKTATIWALARYDKEVWAVRRPRIPLALDGGWGRFLVCPVMGHYPVLDKKWAQTYCQVCGKVLPDEPVKPWIN